jgi:MYXO-CTERM domain-containing protein
MRKPINPMRQTLIALTMVAAAGMPAAAQANTNTTSTSAMVTPDSSRRETPDNDRDFPWGLLGLLGLAGLLGRRKVETVRTVPPAMGRPGDPTPRL